MIAPDELVSVAGPSNPKRERGVGRRPSLTLRVSDTSAAFQISSQHIAVLRFFPTRPIDSIFAMYAHASGTWHDVSPMSTSTVPIARPTAFAFAVSGATYPPTAITKLFMQ